MSPPVHAALSLLLVGTCPGCGSEPTQTPSSAPGQTASSQTSDSPKSSTEPTAVRPVIQHAMTATERRAIAEARSRHLAKQQREEPGQEAQAVEGTTVVAQEATGLTRHEQRAALDDPASKLPAGGSALPESTDSLSASDEPTESSRHATSPRPGVELRGATDGLKLIDLAIATEVKRREPMGVAQAFPEMPRMFHCFCVFENRQSPATVTHVWKRNGRIVSRVELEVGKSPKWRTWSRQRLQPAWTGEWTCEVQTMAGRLLGQASVQAGR